MSNDNRRSTWIPGADAYWELARQLGILTGENLQLRMVIDHQSREIERLLAGRNSDRPGGQT